MLFLHSPDLREENLIAIERCGSISIGFYVIDVGSKACASSGVY